MKSLSILAAILTALNLTHAIPTSPSNAPGNDSVVTCLANCPQTFCLDIWPQSCYCHNAAALECWYECGGVQPQLQACPPQTTPTIGSSSSNIHVPSPTSSPKAAPVAPVGSIITGVSASSVSVTIAAGQVKAAPASTSTSCTYPTRTNMHTVTNKHKRHDSFKPSSTTTSIHSPFETKTEQLRCRTESNPCPGPNLFCVPDTPSDNCLFLFRGACDLPGTCEITEMKPSPPTLTPKLSSFKHLPTPAASTYDPANTTALSPVPCSSITRPCKEEGEVCVVPKDASYP